MSEYKENRCVGAFGKSVSNLFRNKTAESLGLGKYSQIIERFQSADVSADKEFQRLFNAFYRIRFSKTDWQPLFYQLFEEVRGGSRDLDFGKVLEILWERDPKHRVAYSFVSKLFATIDPSRPIIDTQVLKAVRSALSPESAKLITKQGEIKGIGKSKIANAIQVYADLRKYFAHMVKSTEGQECIRCFDWIFNTYSDISDIKKLDFGLWAIGATM